MRYLLIFVLAVSALGSLTGCGYSKLYKDYNDYQDHDDDNTIPKSRQSR